MRFQALRGICWSGVRYAAGEQIPISGRVAEALVARGDIAKVPEPAAAAETAAGKQQEPPADKQHRGGRNK
ncbi:MAG TPA: hypothetical protein VMY35_04595 [Phycisphaerae bacterium]|nr:hypothetical protein [Phycisphaerae bacterium]